MKRYLGWFALLAVPGAALGQVAGEVFTPEFSILPAAPIQPALNPVPKSTPSPQPATESVQWVSLVDHSIRFLLIEHAFRYATEPATRNPGKPFFRGYTKAVGALHGWADGDPFYVNYIGHPMQGAVSGYIWTLNDPRYRNVEFGKNPEYWKSRLRAGAFSFVYSVQLEIGPLSEASIGNVQAISPQYGFVDHVITPALGLAWMIGEDALDRKFIRSLEQKTHNTYLRALLRGGGNPARSVANAVAGKWPWDRPRDHVDGLKVAPPSAQLNTPQGLERPPGVAPFELAIDAYALAASSGVCGGGGATAAFRIHPQWQTVVDVNGCNLNGLEKNLSGDFLSYMAGPRWTPPLSGRLVPYAQVLFGGSKMTQELMFPDRKLDLSRVADSAGLPAPDHLQYTQQFEVDGFAMAAGTGLDFQFNRALALRVLGVEYTHSWMNGLNGVRPPQGLQMKMGMVLHMGTW